MHSEVIASDIPDRMDDYIMQYLMHHDEIPQRVLAFHQQHRLPLINVSPPQGKLLNLMVRISGAQRILEIGTLGGYSTIWMALGLPDHGLITTLEYEPNYIQIAQQSFALAGVLDKIELLPGRALETLATLSQRRDKPIYDLVFIDADKENNPQYLAYALRFSRKGTIIIADNVVRDGKVATDPTDKAPNIRGLRQYYQALHNDPRLDSTAIQTVGAKGWDGLAISIVQ